MADVSNNYQVILKAVIQKITQAELDASVAGLTLNLKPKIDSTGLKSVQDQVTRINKEAGGVSGNGVNIINTKDSIDGLKIIQNRLAEVKRDIDASAKSTIITDVASNKVTSGIIEYADATGKAVTETYRMVDATGKITNNVAKATDFVQTTEKVTTKISDTNNNILNTLSNNVKKVAEWAISTALIYGSLHEIEKAMEYIVSLNKEMTNIRIVTGMNEEQVVSLSNRYNSLAKEMGATTLEVAEGSLEWFRQGKTIEEASELVRSSLMMSKLGNMESAQATEYLTSTLNGFNLEAEDSVVVIDKLVSLDNAYATSVAEIASALQRSANSAQQAGVTFDELASYITVVSSVTRKSAESIGESFKTMFARMENIKLGKMFEDDATTLNDVEKALSLVNIKLRDSENSFRPLGDVINEVASKWNLMNELEQSAVANAIAGVRQRENLIALMRNYNQVLEAQTIQSESAGLSTERYSVYMNNLEASMNRAKAAWEGMWQTTTSSNVIKFFYDVITVIAETIDTVGGLGPIIMQAVGAAILLRKELFATFIAAIPSATAALSKFGLALKGLSFKTIISGIRATIVEMKALNAVSLKNVIGLALMLAGTVVEIVNAIPTLEERIESATEKINELSDAINSIRDSKKNIQSLWAELLILNGITEKTEGQQERWYEIQDKIKEILPSVNGYYDEQGRFIVNTNVPLEVYVGLLQKEYEIKKKIYDQEVKNRIEDEIKQYKRLNDELERNQKALEPPTLSELATAPSLGPSIEVRGGEDDIALAGMELADEVNDSVNQIISDFYALDQAGQKTTRDTLEAMGEEGRAILDIIDEAATYAEETPITPEVDNGPAIESLEELQKAFDDLFKSLVSLPGKVAELINSYEELNYVTFEQAQQLREMFPDSYFKALYTENGVIKLNAQALKELVVQRAQDAVIKARAAEDSIAADVEIQRSSIQSLQMILNNNLAIIQSDDARARSYQNVAQAAYDSAVVQIAAAQATLAKSEAGLAAAKQATSLAETYWAQVQTDAFWANELGNAAGSAASGVGSLSDAQKEAADSEGAYQDLIEITIKMLKQEKEEEINLLEERRDILEDKLDAYDKIIDKRKELLDLQHEEAEYQDELKDKNKELGDIESELLSLQFDNSEEAQARRLELEAERAEKTEEIDDLQADRSLEIQKTALDEEYERYEAHIEKKIKKLDDEIKAIEEYLEKEGLIRADAIALLEAGTDAFWQRLLEWNRIYGTGLDEDVLSLIDVWHGKLETIKRDYSDIKSASSGVGSESGGGSSGGEYVHTGIPTPGSYPGAKTGGCFIEGTKITMPDGNFENIENIKVNDFVLSCDTGNENLLIHTMVVKTFIHDVDEIYTINDFLMVTGEHIVYVNKEWIPVFDIKVGDYLYLQDGTNMEVLSIEKTFGNYKVYNLHTNHDSHNYFANGVLVHNIKTEKSLEEFHEGGIVSIPNIDETEVFAKLLKGEVVANDSQIKNFINTTLPSLILNNSKVVPDIRLEFNVSGNLDKTVVPDIKNITNQVVDRINKLMISRGYIRSVNQTIS